MKQLTVNGNHVKRTVINPEIDSPNPLRHLQPDLPDLADTLTEAPLKSHCVAIAAA